MSGEAAPGSHIGVWVAIQLGGDAAEDYVTAYLVEKSLSVVLDRPSVIARRRRAVSRPRPGPG